MEDLALLLFILIIGIIIYKLLPGRKIHYIKLYHYTNYEGMLGIRRTEQIDRSTDMNRDAILGIGVYLTDVNPWQSDFKIATNNWADGDVRADKYIQAGRLDYVIEIQMKPELVESNRGPRSISLYRGNLDLNHFSWKIYRRSNGQVQRI